MDEVTGAYVAGVMDCDGSFMIVSRPGGRRFEPRASLSQVTPQVPEFMKETFGGDIQYQELRPPKRNRYMWRVSCAGAIKVCEVSLPYLLIKKARAEALLELWGLRDAKYRTYAYWYGADHPDWKSGQLITTREAQAIIGYNNFYSVKQAIKTGVLLALPGIPGKSVARIPKEMALWLASIRDQAPGGELPIIPPGLVDLRRELWKRMKLFNKVGC